MNVISRLKFCSIKEMESGKMVETKVTIGLFFLIFNHSKREFTLIAQYRSQTSIENCKTSRKCRKNYFLTLS